MPPVLAKSFTTVARENAFLTGKTLEQASQNASLTSELDECKDYLTQLNAERALLKRDRQEQEAYLVQLREELSSARTVAHQDGLTIERLRQEVDSLQNERQRQEHATREQAREAAQARDATAEQAGYAGELRATLAAAQVTMRQAHFEAEELRRTVEAKEAAIRSAAAQLQRVHEAHEATRVEHERLHAEAEGLRAVLRCGDATREAMVAQLARSEAEAARRSEEATAAKAAAMDEREGRLRAERAALLLREHATHLQVTSLRPHHLPRPTPRPMHACRLRMHMQTLIEAHALEHHARALLPGMAGAAIAPAGAARTRRPAAFGGEPQGGALRGGGAAARLAHGPLPADGDRRRGRAVPRRRARPARPQARPPPPPRGGGARRGVGAHPRARRRRDGRVRRRGGRPRVLTVIPRCGPLRFLFLLRFSGVHTPSCIVLHPWFC